MATITQEDFQTAQQARRIAVDFVASVLERYKVYALAHEGRDVDATIKRGGGFIRYSVDERSLFDDGVEEIGIVEYTADDRGPGSSRTYKFPKSALFEQTEREKDVATYLALGEKLGFDAPGQRP